jgi:hypothetical protein
VALADRAAVRVAPRRDRLAQLGSLELLGSLERLDSLAQLANRAPPGSLERLDSRVSLDSLVSLDKMARATRVARAPNHLRRADAITRVLIPIRPALRAQAPPGPPLLVRHKLRKLPDNFTYGVW